MRTALGWLLIAAALITCAVGYVFYRYEQAKEYLETGRAAGVPASVCEFRTADFSTASQGILYVYDGAVRIDLTVMEGQDTRQIHYFIDRSGRQFAEPVGKTDAWTVNDVTQLALLVPESPWSCRPWWLPDAKLLEVPEELLQDVE